MEIHGGEMRSEESNNTKKVVYINMCVNRLEKARLDITLAVEYWGRGGIVPLQSTHFGLDMNIQKLEVISYICTSPSNQIKSVF